MKKLLCNVSMIVCIFSGMNVMEAYGQCLDCNNIGCDSIASVVGQCAFAANAADASGDHSAALVNGAATGLRSFAVGESSFARNLQAVAIGRKVAADAPHSKVFGRQLWVDSIATNSIIIGYGEPDLLYNNIPNSIMMGMNSTEPTFFIQDGGGLNHWGRVGIGTTDPQGILHVRDESGVNTNLVIDRNGTAQANLLFNSGGTTPIARIGVNGTGANHLHYDLFQSGGSHIFYVNTSNEAMRIVGNTGNVCIGTQTASGRLHVNHATANTDVVIQRNGSNAARLRFHSGATAAGNLSLTSANDLRMQGLTANRHLIFNVNMGGTDTEAMRIVGSTAYVGIGTADPQGNLHVRNLSDGSATNVVIQKNGFAEANLRFSFSNNAPIARIGLNSTTGHLHYDMLLSNADHIFRVNTDTEVMHIKGANGRVGIGTATPSGRLHVNGTLFAALPATSATSMVVYNPTTDELIDGGASTIYFKENVEDLSFDQEAFLNLRPTNFNWKPARGGQADVGLIAQEVMETFPELAYSGPKRTYFEDGSMLLDSMGIPVEDTTQLETWGVRYHKIPIYLVSIVKGQQEEIAEMRDQLIEMAQQVNNCCSSGPMHRVEETQGNATEVKEDLEEFILLGNDPNPFSDYTDIRFDASACNRCEIVIVDMNGRIVKRIVTKGRTGTIRIYSSEIGTGYFVYSLIQDGQVLRSERMISAR